VHVHRGGVLSGQLTGRADGLVRDGEGRVQTDEASHEGALVGAKKALALGQSPATFFGSSVPVGGPVARGQADAELLGAVGQHVERALDEMGRLVVIDEGGGAVGERVGDGVARGRAQRGGVECAVEPPPDALQDLQEVRRRRRGCGQAQRREA
jgi:hypothetical protein